jgi:bZIP transcription factor
MERHTLQDAATNAAGQPASSHSYSAWRTSQQTTPRIFQYTPPNSQQAAQSQAQQAPQTSLLAQSGPGASTSNLPPNIDKNIVFASSAQQYGLQNAGNQGDASFAGMQVDASNSAENAVDPKTGANAAGGNTTIEPSIAGSAPPHSASSTRVLASTKRAAQNRAAQRAFRQRKERYIKTLEQKATEFDMAQSIIADLRKENVYLRDYVVRLQAEVDGLNAELGRAPMFGSGPLPPQNLAAPAPLQRTQPTNQATAMSVATYPLQIDPATGTTAATGNVQPGQDGHSNLARIAPAEVTSISVPANGDGQMADPHGDEGATGTGKKARGRKRKNESAVEGQ